MRGRVSHQSGKQIQREITVVQREGDTLPGQNRLHLFSYLWNNMSHLWWFGEEMKHSVQVWNGCVNQEQMEFTVQRGNILRASPEILLQTSFKEKSGENCLFGSFCPKIHSPTFHLAHQFCRNNIKLNQALAFAISSSFYSECNCKRTKLQLNLAPFKYFISFL